MTKHRCAAAVAVGGLVAAALTACSGYTDGERPGRAYPEYSFDDDTGQQGHAVHVRLPIGTLTITTGRPVQQIDTGSDHRAADGATFVPVSWSMSANASQAVRLGTLAMPSDQFQITLLADGRRYGLQAGQPSIPADLARRAADMPEYAPIVDSKDLAVAVQGDGRHVRYAVDYAGVTQTADVDTGHVDAGVAAPYYRTGGLPVLKLRAGCRLLSTTDRRRFKDNDSCRLGAVQLVPYVGGLGWVGSAKQSWALVQVVSQPFAVVPISDSGAYYDLDRFDLDLRLDGVSPVRFLPSGRNDNDSTRRIGVEVFRVTGTPKTLVVRSALHVHDDKTRATRVFRNAQTIGLDS